ncbi:MAG: DUF192 domain-containing protein, partial [Nanoarchaeota archaeon]|nr:DUF192 domain-containing protein [Nanoarchaeota archaeon]
AEKIMKILEVFFLIFLIGCAKNFDEKINAIGIHNGKDLIKINVEIADDNEERMKGLMFRERLDENAGMLFVFEDEQYQAFWMKNTLIPLDIIFIGKNLEIVDIENAVPCKIGDCALYKSSKPSTYVLEVNSGFSARNNIKMGDKLVINGKILKQ